MNLDFYWIHFVASQKLGNKKPRQGVFYLAGNHKSYTERTGLLSITLSINP